jgi:hypothetical protein
MTTSIYIRVKQITPFLILREGNNLIAPIVDLMCCGQFWEFARSTRPGDIPGIFCELFVPHNNVRGGEAYTRKQKVTLEGNVQAR